MKLMQPVPIQDRPKLIAVSVALAIAVGVVVRNIAGTTILARPKEPEKVATSAAALNGSGSSASPDPAGFAASSANDEAPVEAATFADSERPRLHDPFHPLAETRSTAPSAEAVRAPVSTTAPVPPRPAPAAPRPAVRPAAAVAKESVSMLPPGARTAGMAVVAACDQPMLSANVRRDDSASLPSRPAAEKQAGPVEGGVDSVTLVGTVGEKKFAVALFRVGEKTILARPSEIVAGWSVTRIEVGQVWLSRHSHPLSMHAGDSLQNSARQAD